MKFLDFVRIFNGFVEVSLIFAKNSLALPEL